MRENHFKHRSTRIKIDRYSLITDLHRTRRWIKISWIIISFLRIILPNLLWIIINIIFYQQLSASNDVIVTAKNKRGKSAKTSYHLTIVMLNIMDLPYYCFHMYFVGRAIFKWKSFKMETTGPVTENISDILFCFFLLGHSINLVIYLLFHKEFQANALRIIHKVWYIFFVNI